ncbi:hypothetical protein V8G54_015730 [Vigna mungo]|uniref:Uncharacterized protein n=1 Tax=Vigna mungo TaxID=3915 RepID=A0AAQ3NLL9_VIGMU
MKQHPQQKEKTLNLRKKNPHTIRKRECTPQLIPKPTIFQVKRNKNSGNRIPDPSENPPQAFNFKSNPHSFKSKIKNQLKEIHYKTKSRSRIPNPSENPQASTQL